MAWLWSLTEKAAAITISLDQLTMEQTGPGGWYGGKGEEFLPDNSKWYWEVTVDNKDAAGSIMIGIAKLAAANTYPGENTLGYGYFDNGNYYFNGGGTGAPDTFFATDIIGIAVDTTALKIWWSNNGVWQTSGDPATGANPAYTISAGDYYPMVGMYHVGDVVTASFTPESLTYTPPVGFSAPAPNEYVAFVDGYVAEYSSPVDRTVRLYRRDTGELQDSATSSGVGGYYYLETSVSGVDHFVVAFDDEAGDSFNALIIDGITPEIVV
jgi:hypothetical protein